MTEKEFYDFIHVAENLKNNTRHSVTSTGRPESVAEHSWRVSLMALLLEDEIVDVDFNKIMRMCILHDLGDEDKMVFRLMDTLPNPQRDKFVALFEEMLALETKEAKIFKALDKLEAVIQHNEAPISSWLPLEYELNQTYGREEAEKAGSVLSDLRLAAVEHTKRKIEAERP